MVTSVVAGDKLVIHCHGGTLVFSEKGKFEFVSAEEQPETEEPE